MSNEIKIFGSVNDYARDFINNPENNISKFYFELNHTLVISNNNLYAWKNKCSDQISETESKKALTPNRIKFFDGKIIRKICCGCDHRIVVCDDGVYTWGYNYDAQLGTGNFTNASSPVRIDFFNGKIIRKISCGSFFAIVVCDDGVYGWGRNLLCELGNRDSHFILSPIRLDFLDGKEVLKIVCGSYHTVAVCSDGVYSWGQNSFGQIGINSRQYSSVKCNRVKFFDDKHIRKIRCGEFHTVALCDDGLYVWGRNLFCQLGTNDTTNIYSPKKLKFFNDKDILNIFCGKRTTIAICNDGVYVWGYNYNGMLGINHSGTIYSPTESHDIDNTNMQIEKIFCGDGISFIMEEKLRIKAAIAPVMRCD